MEIDRFPLDFAFTPKAKEASPLDSLYEPIAVLHFPSALA